MISQDVYTFLNDLKFNNNREWFQENRTTYESCKLNIIHAVELLIHEISSFDQSISGVLPKKSIFRINRDIRFSNNKLPYKTNFGAFIAPEGRNSGKAGYYFHIEPGNSFIGGGIYMPPSPVLKAIRNEIFENYEEFLEIVTDHDFVKYFKELTGEKLKTRPRGYTDDFEGIEYLKLKHFTVINYKSDDYFKDENAFKNLLTEFESIYAFNRFLNAINPEDFK